MTPSIRSQRASLLKFKNDRANWEMPIRGYTLDYQQTTDWSTSNDYTFKYVDNNQTGTSQITAYWQNSTNPTITVDIDVAEWKKLSDAMGKMPTPQIPARVVAPPSGFNRYVNASDLLGEFIAFLGEEGVRQGQVMGMPVDLFIKWLIIRAAEADQVDPQVTISIPPPPAQPRCLGCQRYMRRDTHVLLHNERCARHYFSRQREPLDARTDQAAHLGAPRRSRTRSRGRRADLVAAHELC